jgi:hypothetical protein
MTWLILDHFGVDRRFFWILFIVELCLEVKEYSKMKKKVKESEECANRIEAKLDALLSNFSISAPVKIQQQQPPQQQQANQGLFSSSAYYRHDTNYHPIGELQPPNADHSSLYYPTRA